MKSLLINIVAVTFLGASGTALATSSGNEAPPLGMERHLERGYSREYSLARSDQDNLVRVQHRYDNRRFKPHKEYRNGRSHHPKYSHRKPGHGKYDHDKHDHGKYKPRKHRDNKYHDRGPQKHGHGYRHGYSPGHHYNKHSNDLSIRLKFGSDGLIHYHSR